MMDNNNNVWMDNNNVPYNSNNYFYNKKKRCKRKNVLVGISFARKERANLAEGQNWRVTEIDKLKCQFDLSYGAKDVPEQYNDC